MEEELLNCWLKLSLTIASDKRVQGMPYNEALICNILFYHEKTNQEKMTASQLCEYMHMLKSQMNRTLNSMEEKGYINRMRSEKDKRKIYIQLNHEHLDIYLKQHQNILSKINKIISQFGEERVRETIKMINLLSSICEEVL